ncbi:MAG: glycosyltransferase family 39 protein [Elainellaceae cyanobacterium]
MCENRSVQVGSKAGDRVSSKRVQKQLSPLVILIIIAGLGLCIDSIWLALDYGIPSWDPADHLIGSLNYWWTLSHGDWLSQDGWTGLWTLSSKYPPLLYITTAPFLSLLGAGIDPALRVNSVYTVILLVSVYGLGQQLFSPRVGLWAVGLCVLFPEFYSLRTQYFMDYPLAALTIASVWVLTLWRDASSRWAQWGLALGFGTCFGLALLMKQTAVFFLALPVLWMLGRQLQKRSWERLIQLFSGLLIALVLMIPWSRHNWVFQISAAFSANTRSAAIEGDPPVTSLGAWTFYWQQLPSSVSYPLLIVPIVGLILGITVFRHRTWIDQSSGTTQQYPQTNLSELGWLMVFLAGAYIIWSAIANKDIRYIMPWLPIWSIVLAYGLTRFPRRWRAVPWATVGLAVVLMIVNLFPVAGQMGDRLSRALAPGARHHPERSAEWAHAEIIDEIIRTQPYQIATLGVLPSTPEINQHNLTYYGNLENFRVYARRMGKDDESMEQDVRSLSWFLSVTKPQLTHHDPKSRNRQNRVVRMLRQSPDFEKRRSWTLPDGSRLHLFHRRVAPVEVQPQDSLQASSQALSEMATPATLEPTTTIQLDDVRVPDAVPPGHPVPVTYTWSGSWQQLHDGLVLLTWKHADTDQPGWLHDHGIGLGTLHPQPIQANQTTLAESTVDAAQPFQIVERMAMLPPEGSLPGRYTLEATYLNPSTGDTYPIEGVSASLVIDSNAPPTPAPPLDNITQLRQFATVLPQGVDALEPVFEQIGRLNLYDPVQTYVVQAEQLLSYRLQQQPARLEYAYGLALSRVLQRKADSAIAAFERVTQLDPSNPNAYAYLAFVNLYDLNPAAAQRALKPALELNPDSTEFRILNGIAALMRGNVIQAWRDGKVVLGT